MMANLFFGERPAHYNVAFKDGDRNNRKLSNLYYASRFDVMQVAAQPFVIGTPLPPDEPETWWNVGPEFPNYSISTLGRVNANGVIMRPSIANGYPIASLKHREGHSKSFAIHVLMALVFLGPRPKGHDVTHKDDVKTNGRLSNLAYDTKSNNITQAQRIFKRPLVATSNQGDTIHFSCPKDASKHFMMSEDTIRYHLAHDSCLWHDSNNWEFKYTSDSKKQPKQLAPTDRTDWRPLAGFQEYECLPDGRIRRIGSKYLRAASKGDRDYYYLCMRKNKHDYSCAVHVLICETFHGPRPSPKHMANHLDEDKTNNHASNLSWDENNTEYSLGQPVECLQTDGTWKWYPSIKRAQKETGAANICNAVQGKIKTSGGFVWRKAEQRREII
jgi:hypothetical protein